MSATGAGVIPTAIMATSLPTAVKVIGFMTQSGHETLQRPVPEGKFWVVGISAEGNSYGMLSIPDAPADRPIVFVDQSARDRGGVGGENHDPIAAGHFHSGQSV